jgi:hypothetical protein
MKDILVIATSLLAFGFSFHATAYAGKQGTLDPAPSGTESVPLESRNSFVGSATTISVVLGPELI